MCVLSAKHITYQHSDHFCIEDIHIDIQKGEIVSLIGPNGSGKSTLLRLLSHVLKPIGGTVLLDGSEIHTLSRKAIAKKMAMLPQTNNHQLDMTVRELVEFGRNPHKGWFQSLNEEDEKVIRWALEMTNLQSYEYRFLHSLSGGERQRAWIAMALAQRPEVLLLDEPTTYLDISHQLEVMELIQMLNHQLGMTVVMVLHDINQAAQYSDRMIVMKDGKIQYDDRTQCVICKQMFQDIFGIDVDIRYEGDKPFFIPIRKTCHIPCLT